MAIPALPTAKNTEDIIDNAWVDAVRDLLALFRDDRPAFYGRNKGKDAITTSVDTTSNFSNGAGAFEIAPVYNIGGWTAATGGDLGIVVPETGLYEITGWLQFTAGTAAGVRRGWLLDTGSEISGSRVAAAQNGSGSVATSFSTGTVLRHLTASTDILNVGMSQNSGGDLDVVTFLTAVWVGSSAS